MCGQRTPKLTKISLLFRKFRTFPVTEGYAIWHSIFSSQPQQESSPTEQNLSMSRCRKTRILETPWFFATLGQRKCQKTDPERCEFWQRYNSSLPWARESPNPTAKDTNFTQNCTHWPRQKCQGKYSFFQNFAHRFEMHSLTPFTLTKTTTWGTPSSMFPQLQTNCDTFGQ